MDKEPELAGEMIALIARMYGLESELRAANQLGSAEHLIVRQTATRAIQAEIHAWLAANKDKCLPKGPLGRAISYTQNQWKELQLCCDDATLPLDNNMSENALRAVAIGRKNWMFMGNEASAQRYAVLLTLLTTAAANGLHPERWLTDTLMALESTKVADLSSLLPLAAPSPEAGQLEPDGTLAPASDETPFDGQATWDTT